MYVWVAETFEEAIQSLSKEQRQKAWDALMKFSKAPQRPGLNWRRLRGAPGHWVINFGSGYRIVLRQDDEETFAAIDVGPHDDLYRRWNR